MAALRSPHLAVARKAPLGLGFEVERGSARSLVEVETLAGGVGQLSLPYSLRWLLDVLSGLGALHEADLDPGGPGFVHGELTPERLWLDAGGVGKLVPLVPAHWTPNRPTSGEWIGYLAPEALLGDAVDVRADVFSAGVLLWEALAAQRLFNEPSADAIVMRLMSGKVDLPPLPAEDGWAAPLATIARRAISVNPKQRFASARELAAEIERAAADHLASRSGMADLYRDPASGSRKIVAAVTVPRPQPAESSARAEPAAAVPQPSSNALSDDVDVLLATPVPPPRAEPQLSERSAVPVAAAASPRSERSDSTLSLDVADAPRRRGRGVLWLFFALVLVAGGVLAYPPLRSHPLVAGWLGKLPLPAGPAPGYAERDSASVPAERPALAAPSGVPSASEVEAVDARPEQPPPPGAVDAASRSAGRALEKSRPSKLAAKPRRDTTSPERPEPKAPAERVPAEPVPAASAPAEPAAPSDPPPAPKPAGAQGEGDGYGI